MLSRYQIGQRVRTDGPQTHLHQSGTPTMGGGLILVAMAFGTLAVGRSVQPLRVDLAGHHAGLRPDRLLRRLPETGGGQFQGPGGALQVSGAIGGRPWSPRSRCMACIRPPAETSLYVPFFKTVAVPMTTVGFVAFAYFVIVGTSNAVNLTDGLDGLAIMPAVMVAAALGVFAYATGNIKFADLPADSLHQRRGRGADFQRHAGGRGSWVSCGSTPIPRKSSWAMSVRSPSAPRSAPWR